LSRRGGKDAHGRQLPHNDEAEAGVLGGVILQNQALALLDALEVADFYNPRHRVVFSAMRNLEAAGSPIDVLTLEHEVKRNGKLDAIGGVSFLGELTLRVPTIDNVETYASIVRKQRITRDVMVMLSNMLDEAYHGESEGDQLVHDVTTALLSVRTGQESPVVTMAQLIAEEAERVSRDVEARAAGQVVFSGVPTGIALIDEKIGGHPLATPTLYIARPGMGKTTVAMHVNRAANAAGEPSMLATYEDRGQSFGQRGLAQETGLSTELLRARRIKVEELVTVASGVISGGARRETLLVASGLSAEALVRRVRRESLLRVHRGQRPIRQLLVDYVQKMPMPDHTRSRDEGITHISQVLSTYAVDENAALGLFAQLNREVEKRDDHRPRLSDIRESGSLEQDGKVIFGIYHPHRYEPTKKDPATGDPWTENDLLLLCLKNAQGESGFDIKLWVDLKSHMIHETQLDQGANAARRGVDFSKHTKKPRKSEQEALARFDEAPPPDPDWHNR
jgi:replicative DNA helicase